MKSKKTVDNTEISLLHSTHRLTTETPSLGVMGDALVCHKGMISFYNQTLLMLVQIRWSYLKMLPESVLRHVYNITYLLLQVLSLV